MGDDADSNEVCVFVETNNTALVVLLLIILLARRGGTIYQRFRGTQIPERRGSASEHNRGALDLFTQWAAGGKWRM